MLFWSFHTDSVFRAELHLSLIPQVRIWQPVVRAGSSSGFPAWLHQPSSTRL